VRPEIEWINCILAFTRIKTPFILSRGKCTKRVQGRMNKWFTASNRDKTFFPLEFPLERELSDYGMILTGKPSLTKCSDFD